MFTSPPEGVARYCFHPVCVCVCVSVVNGQGHREGTLLFEGTVISQKLSHRKLFFFIDTS